MRKAAYLLLLMVAESAAVVRAYSVEPVCADWSGWTGFQNTVSEVITCNFDSLAYVELFAGAKGAGGAYTATVLEDGMPLTSSDGDRVPDHAWVRFDAWTQQVGFTKGKQYEFKFTRSGSDSIQFYFQHGDPYPWGEMKVAGEGNTDKDLCMRLSGQMKVVDETYFGMIPAAYPDAQLMGQWKDRLRESGAKRVLFDIYWPQIQPTGPGNWDFSTFDSRLAYLADTLGCEVLARVQLSPKWASARVDSVWFVDTILDTAYMRLDTSVYCAPRNLWMSTVPEDSNYWARFIDSLVKHYDNAVYGGIHDWEVFNEMNDTSLGVSGFTGWWRRPNVQYDLEGGLRGLCSLYVKLCDVAAEQIRGVSGHSEDRVFVGSLAGATWGTSGVAPGVQTAAEYYGIVNMPGGPGVFWDGISFHPYQDWHPAFDPVRYEHEAETLRTVMRTWQDFGLLWNTEVGWCTTWTKEQNAENLCEAYTCAKGSEVLPQGGYDWTCWFLFREPWRRFGHWGLVDSSMDTLRPAFFAYRQLLTEIAGKRFTGRVMLGDARDDTVRLYEFERTEDGSRTWVCWRNDMELDGTGPRTLVQLPARCAEPDTLALDYDGSELSDGKEAEVDGWLALNLSERPVFVSEAGTIERPDMLTDSVRLFPANPSVGRRFEVHAWVRNLGSEPHPIVLSATGMKFYCNGDSIGAMTWLKAEKTDGVYEFCLVHPGLDTAYAGQALFAADVNPGQRFVELGLDDNAAYRRAVVGWSPWPYVKIDSTGSNNGRLLAVEPGGDIHVAFSGSDTVRHDVSADGGSTWSGMTDIGPGVRPSVCLDSAGAPWVVFVQDDTLWCSAAAETLLMVYGGSGQEHLGQPSVQVYPNDVAGQYVCNVAFAVYDPVNDLSRILYAKAGEGSVLLDTVDVAYDLSDSCPSVCVANSDSIFVTWQRDGDVSSAMLEYEAGSWAAPDSWSAPESVAAAGSHPSSLLDGEFLHCVWREFLPGSDTQAIRSAVRYVGSDPQMYQDWQAGPDRSQWDEHPKDRPVVAGHDVVVWQERTSANEPWDIRAHAWGDTITLVATVSNSCHPHAVAEMSSVSPSIDQIRIRLLWTEEVVQDGDTYGELRFQVDSLNRSKAAQYATATGNGAKLVRKPGSDSLFSVYRDADWCIMHAWSADGTEWEREPLFPADAADDYNLGSTDVSASLESPALAYDSTGRRWLVFVKPPVSSHSDTSSLLLGTWRTGDTWATPQVVYEIDVDSGSVTGPSLAGASDGSVPCAYAAFLVKRRRGTDVKVAKFDGDDLVTSTVQTGLRRTDPPCIASEPEESGDDLHLCWTDAGDVEYTMTAAAVPADSWSPTPFTWETPVNLTSTVAASWAPVTGVSGNRVVVAWAEQGDSSESYLSDVWSSCRSLDSAYDNWEDALNLSQSANSGSDNPLVGTERDSVVVAWQEWTQGTGSEDIVASVEFSDPVVLVSQPFASYPHALLKTETTGGDTAVCIHVIWSEEPEENYYEVGYAKCELGGSGGGGQQGGGPLIQPLLYACRPNPFSGRTAISYQFPFPGRVLLRIYDASGRSVKTLQNGWQQPGRYTANWDGCDDRGRAVAHGVYFYRIDAPGLEDTKKAVVTK